MRIRNKELRKKWHRKAQRVLEIRAELKAAGKKPKPAPAKKEAPVAAEKPKKAPAKKKAEAAAPEVAPAE